MDVVFTKGWATYVSVTATATNKVKITSVSVLSLEHHGNFLKKLIVNFVAKY